MVASMIHRKFPKMIQMHSYIAGNSLDRKLSNWRLLNTKCFSRLRLALSEEELQCLAQRGKDVSGLLIRLLRELRLKMNAFEPQYLAKVNINGTDQRMKAEAMSSAYSKNRKPLDDPHASDISSAVGKTMRRLSSGISPPQSMKQAARGDVSKRPSRIAANIAGVLGGIEADTEILLGSAGRR